MLQFFSSHFLLNLFCSDFFSFQLLSSKSLMFPPLLKPMADSPSLYVWSLAFDQVNYSLLLLLWIFYALGFQNINLSLFSFYLSGCPISFSWDGPSFSPWPKDQGLNPQTRDWTHNPVMTPVMNPQPCNDMLVCPRAHFSCLFSSLFSLTVSGLGPLLFPLSAKLHQIPTSFAPLFQVWVQGCFISWPFPDHLT